LWEQPWPQAEEAFLERDVYEVVCQVNGKLRDRVQVAAGAVIQPVAAEDVKVVLPKRDVSGLKIEYDIPSAFNGPLLVGSPIGLVNVRAGGQVITRVAALSPVSVGNATQLLGTSVVHDGTAGVQGVSVDAHNAAE
jgi:leucyl-tRNA synthetase